MNSDKIIEEAAKNHMLEQSYSSDDKWGKFPCCIDDIEKQCTNDFKAGVEWLRRNLGILVKGNTENEYIRGDLVELDNELKVVLIPEPSNFIVSDISDRHKTTLCSISDIKSIPLTPQILVNDGWEICNGGCLSIDKGSFYDHNIAIKENYQVCLFYPIANPKKFTFREYRECGTTYNEIEYVHQLQHLLFGLGLDSKVKI